MTDKVNIFGGIKCLAAKMVLVRDTIQRCPFPPGSVTFLVWHFSSSFPVCLSCPKWNSSLQKTREKLNTSEQVWWISHTITKIKHVRLSEIGALCLESCLLQQRIIYGVKDKAVVIAYLLFYHKTTIKIVVCLFSVPLCGKQSHAYWFLLETCMELNFLPSGTYLLLVLIFSFSVTSFDFTCDLPAEAMNLKLNDFKC